MIRQREPDLILPCEEGRISVSLPMEPWSHVGECAFALLDEEIDAPITGHDVSQLPVLAMEGGEVHPGRQVFHTLQISFEAHINFPSTRLWPT